VVYSGRTDRAGAHFSSLGYAAAPGVNIADHILDVVIKSPPQEVTWRAGGQTDQHEPAHHDTSAAGAGGQTDRADHMQCRQKSNPSPAPKGLTSRHFHVGCGCWTRVTDHCSQRALD
jgi:hypothetical protein